MGIKVFMFLKIFIMAFLSSCAAQNYQTKQEVKVELPKIVEPDLEFNGKFWIGKSERELLLHPLYASFEAIERRTDSNAGTKSFKVSGNCSHVFYLKNYSIYKLIYVGTCSENLNYRPLDNDEKPILSAKELKEWSKYYDLKREEESRKAAVAAATAKNIDSKPIACNKRQDCPETMTCKISNRGEKGICGHFGIFGQIFNN